MLKRSLVRLFVVLALGLALLVGAIPTARAGEGCVRIGLPTPIPDVGFCFPTE